MTLTDAIAGLALFVSVLAAISAGKSAASSESSATSAAVANHLAQHNERLLIYKSLQKFHFELQAHGAGLKDEALWAFWDAANLSEFYYPQEACQELINIGNFANGYLAMRELLKSHQEGGPAYADRARLARATLHSQGAELRTMCKACDEKLRQSLRLEPKDENA